MSEIVQERRLVTEIPGPLSRERLARKKTYVADGVGTMLPVFVTAAGGGVLVDVDGNSLIDFGSGIAVTGVGNSAERVVERVTEQVARFTHTCFMVAPYEGYVEVCEELNRLTPGDHEKRSALFNSGAEAVENAVKIARYATGRPAGPAQRVGHRDPVDLAGERAEPVLVRHVLGGQRHGQVGAPVVGVIEDHDGGPAGGIAGDLHRVLHRFRAGVEQG